ncbi:MAG: LysR family transcriptional regulator [Pseudomonadota bacterium]
MSEFDTMKIRRLDLTILLIFLALLRTRKAVDVAGELGLTSSSISHALKRLRDVFEDDLFLRRPHGLEPTAYALELEPFIRQSVESLQSALSGPSDFDPATAQETIRIAAHDREVAAFIPDVYMRIARLAPGVRFAVRTLTARESLDHLRDGTLDLAIGFFSELGDEFVADHLRTEDYVVIARAGHPILKGGLTLADYVAASHVLVSRDGSMSGIVDTTLGEMGLSRTVCLALPGFLPALAAVARSDFVATLPRAVALQNIARFDLAYAEPPMPIRPFDVSIVRHRRNLRSPLLSWCLRAFVHPVADT